MNLEIIERKVYKHLLSMRLSDRFELDIPYQLTANGEVCFASSVETDGNIVKAVIGESIIQDEMEPEGNLLKVTRKWTLNGDFGARVSFSVLTSMKATMLCVPGALYSKGEDIKKVVTGIGHIDEAHCTIPGCSIISGGGRTLALFTRPSGSLEESIIVSTQVSSDHVELNITLPGDNAIKSGVFDKLIASSRYAEWDVDDGLAYERVFYIMPAMEEKPVSVVVDEAWKKIFFPVEVEFDYAKTVSALSDNLLSNFYIERNDAVGFVDRVSSSGMTVSPVLCGSFRGGNIEAAYALYRTGLLLKSEPVKRMALDTVDFFLSSVEREDSLRLDYHTSLRRWRGPMDEEAAARDSGELILATTKVHHAAQPSDYNPRWIFTAKKLAENLFAKWRASLDKMGSDKKDGKEKHLPAGNAASYLVSAFVELFLNTGEQRFMEAATWLGDIIAKNIEDRFLAGQGEKILSRDDAHSYLRAFLKLHRETNKTEYFDSAVLVAQYLKTLTYSYKLVMPAGELSRNDFDTCGGVSEVPLGGWLDPFPVVIALELLHLWKTSGDDSWRSVAEANLSFSMRAAAGLVDRISYINEKNFHTPVYGKWGAAADLSCWPVALLLSGIFDISDQFPEIITFDKTQIELDETNPASIKRTLKYLGSYIGFFS